MIQGFTDGMKNGSKEEKKERIIYIYLLGASTVHVMYYCTSSKVFIESIPRTGSFSQYLCNRSGSKRAVNKNKTALQRIVLIRVIEKKEKTR